MDNQHPSSSSSVRVWSSVSSSSVALHVPELRRSKRLGPECIKLALSGEMMGFKSWLVRAVVDLPNKRRVAVLVLVPGKPKISLCS